MASNNARNDYVLNREDDGFPSRTWRKSLGYYEWSTRKYFSCVKKVLHYLEQPHHLIRYSSTTLLEI